jgi:hypothetical protein
MARGVGPMMRMSAEHEGDTHPSSVLPPEAEAPIEGARPNHTGGFRHQPALSVVPRKATFSSEDSASTNRMQWAPEDSGKNRSHAIVRFFRRPGRKAKPVTLETASDPAPNKELETAKEVQPSPELPDGPEKNTKWQPLSEKPQPALITFPTNRSQQHSLASFREPVRPPSIPSLQMRTPEKSNSNDRPFAGHNLETAEANVPSVSRNGARAESWPGNDEVGADLPPTCWPELPDSSQFRATTSWAGLPDSEAFAATTFYRQPASQSVAQSRFPASLPNSWPDLAPDPVSKDYNWRSLMRSVQRAQRLEKEQRGY